MIFEIPILDLNFSYRDDILFRAFVLKTKNKEAWKIFCSIKGNRKVIVKSLYKMRDSLKKDGQKTAINIVKKNEEWFPADGATRLGCMLSLGFENIKVIENPINTNRKWNDPKNIDTHHFKDMPENIMADFLEFKKRLINHEDN